MVNKLLDGVSYLKSKLATDELEEKLNEAVSEQNWQASTQLLHEIANASFNYEKEQRILAFLWEKLKHKSWKKVLKTLHLADFLLKYGPSSLVNALKDNIYEFRNFDSYALVTDGVDRGESIRKQSRAVVSLLSDDHFLNDERARAKQIKDRMANVIGTGAYYGSFSNDGSSLPSAGTARKDTYQSFSASSYRPGFGSGGSTGMTFGESVMRSLQQAKKEERVDPPPYEEKPAGKLNLAKMNIAKPEEKKNFNSLSMKLVKPPEKKAAEKKEQPVPAQKQQPKPQRPAAKVDIMDFDFLGSVPEPNQEQTVDNSSKSNTFDFLGAPTTTNPPASQSQTSFNVLNFTPTSTNGQINSSVPHQGIAHQPTAPQNFLYGGSSVPAFNFVPAAQSVPLNFISPQSIPPVPAVSISLSAPPQPKTSASSSLDLIDFSNFREQLSRSGQQPEEKHRGTVDLVMYGDLQLILPL